MRIAIEGCCHGELDNIYATLKEAQESDGKQVDLLLICGDFQAIRNYSDLQSLAVPEKYRQLGGFYRYYSGEATAPCLTIVIGGNHEASNYMWELFHGGWLAPNIYYLGAAGSVLVNGLRISGASGIYKSGDYRKGRFERHPYDRSTIRSIYHTREYDIARLSLLAAVSAYPTIFLSHDWPLEIERYGDTTALIRKKPFFKDEIASNTLGSPPLRGLLDVLKPQYWFAAHLHVKFAALYKHDHSSTRISYPQRGPRQDKDSAAAPDSQKGNPDELQIDDDDDEVCARTAAQNPAFDGKVASAVDLIHPEAPLEGTIDHSIPTDSVDESIAFKEVEQSSALPGSNVDEIAINDSDEDAPVSTPADTAQASRQDDNNPDEIELDDEMEDGDTAAVGAASASKLSIQTHKDKCNVEASATRFLALSKCLPGQDFLQIMDVQTPDAASSPVMTLDPVWLAITRAFHSHLSLKIQQSALPSEQTICKALIDKELNWVQQNVKDGGMIPVEEVQQFQQTAPFPGQPGGDDTSPGSWFTNPQTEAFCKLIDVENKINPVPPELRMQMSNGQ